MINHFFALTGLSLLCAVWVLFQIWLAKKDKSYRGYKAGCGACGKGSCSSKDTTSSLVVKKHKIKQSVKTHESNN